MLPNKPLRVGPYFGRKRKCCGRVPLPTTDPMEPFRHQVLRVSNTNPQLVKSTKLFTAFWVHFEMEAMEQTFRCRTAKAFLACSGVAKRTSLIQYAKLCKVLCIAENQAELSLTHKTNWDLRASSAPTLAPSTWRGGRWRAPNKPLYFDSTFWNAEFPCSTHFVRHLFSTPLHAVLAVYCISTLSKWKTKASLCSRNLDFNSLISLYRQKYSTPALDLFCNSIQN